MSHLTCDNCFVTFPMPEVGVPNMAGNKAFCSDECFEEGKTGGTAV